MLQTNAEQYTLYPEEVAALREGDPLGGISTETVGKGAVAFPSTVSVGSRGARQCRHGDAPWAVWRGSCTTACHEGRAWGSAEHHYTQAELAARISIASSCPRFMAGPGVVLHDKLNTRALRTSQDYSERRTHVGGPFAHTQNAPVPMFVDVTGDRWVHTDAVVIDH